MTPFARWLLFSALLWLVPGESFAQSFPNEPAGSVLIEDCPMNNNTCGWNRDFSTQVDTFVSGDGGTALDSHLPVGTTVGNGTWSRGYGNIRSIYMMVRVAQNADFIGNLGPANKFWFARNPQYDNSFINWDGNAQQWRWYQQGPWVNTHIEGTFGMTPTDGSGWFYPNSASNGVMRPGTGYHTLEVCIVSSTTATSRDGVIRWWLDGQLAGNYTNANIAHAGITEGNINHTWDGFNTANRDTSKRWDWFIAHMRLSRPTQGCGAGSSGGTLPPADTTPPSTVTGLTITKAFKLDVFRREEYEGVCA